MSKPTAEEKRFHLSVMAQGCCVCGGVAVFHHVSMPHGLPRRNHWWGAGLCDKHHVQYHTECGNVEIFLEIHDVNLVTEAIRNYWLYGEGR